jgi:hypothetical protein
MFMRLPAALVISVLIWSTARYLPPYFVELHKIDIQEEKLALETSHAKAMLKQMQLHLDHAARAHIEKPVAQREQPLY